MFILGQMFLNLDLNPQHLILIESSLKPTKASPLFSIKNNVILNVSNHAVLFLYKSGMQTQWINKQSVGGFIAMKGV